MIMRISKRPTIAFMLSTVVLLLGGITAVGMMDLTPGEIDSQSLAQSLMYYRIGAYLVVLAAWEPIAKFLCRPRMPRDQRTPEIMRTWEELTARLTASRWKVALFFAVFELVAVQKVGF